MDDKTLRILIVSHTFPPAAGIGGRRWAKFAKYLKRKGNQVEVLSAALKTSTKSPWIKDIEGITQYFYKNSFPKILTEYPSSLTAKFYYRCCLAYMRYKTNGTPYDRAILDIESCKTELNRRIIEFKPHVLIVTGAPFSLLRASAGMLDNYKGLISLADFRDPWSWGTAYGYKSLPGQRSSYEKEGESLVMEKFSVVTSPWPQIIEMLKKKYPSSSQKLALLPHGFDREDLDLHRKNRAEEPTPFLVYGGSIYSDCLHFIDDLGAYFDSNLKKHEFHIYSDSDRLSSLGKGVFRSKLVPSAEFLELASNAKWVLFLIPEHAKDGIPTKLYELAALGTPIFAMGYEGELSNLIEEKGLGRFAKGRADIDRIFGEPFTVKDQSKWINSFDLDKITDELMDLISQNSKGLSR